MAACIVALGVSSAFAARLSNESHGASFLASDVGTKPTTRPLTKPRAQAKTTQARRKARRKNKTLRHPNVFYRWSAEQLMLGGVNPSRIGKGPDDANEKASSKSATSPK
jgi:hypothetical protein